jgi:hypothetical protein
VVVDGVVVGGDDPPGVVVDGTDVVDGPGAVEVVVSIVVGGTDGGGSTGSGMAEISQGPPQSGPNASTTDRGPVTVRSWTGRSNSATGASIGPGAGNDSAGRPDRAPDMNRLKAIAGWLPPVT